MGADSALGSISADTLILNEGATIEADTITFAGGVLGGTGVFPFDVVNTGTIAPGDTAFSTGVFTVDAGFTQTSEGVLGIELGGPAGVDAHDQLVVTDTAGLGGTLRVTVLPGTGLPITGHSYTILAASAVQQRFDSIELQEGLDATITYGETEVTIAVSDFVNVATEDVSPTELPSEVTLYENYPNPFNPTTRIEYAVPATTRARLTVVDALGRLVATLLDADVEAGRHAVSWDAGGVGSGVYFYRLEADGRMLTRSMFLSR
jgi:hypothetical protein